MFKCILFLILSLQAFRVSGGQEVGNGGGFVLCADNKYYSYDFVLSTNNSFGNIQLDLSLKQIVQRISQQLHRINEPLVKEFDEFILLAFQQIPGKKFQWLQMPNLPLMWEPELNRLPPQCRTRKQAVIFMSSSGSVPYVSYTYDSALIQEVRLQPNGDLQVSFLIVHEWLWNHFSRRTFLKLAYFNRLLHSDKIASMTSEEYFKLRNAFFGQKN